MQNVVYSLLQSSIIKIFIMKNQLLWGVYFIVPLMFILSVMLPDMVGVVLVPAGMLAAVIVLIADIISNKLLTRVQVFKLFCDSLLVMRFGQLYEHETVSTIAAAVGILSVFMLVVFFSCKLEELNDEARQIDKAK